MAHNHGTMDMSGMDGTTSTGGGMSGMKMYFHGSIGSDMLWFASWMPSSAGATVGVCIGVFVIAIFERYLAAVRRACDTAWQRGQIGFVVPSSIGSFAIPAQRISDPPTQKFKHLPTSSSSVSSDEITPIALSQPRRTQTPRADDEKGDVEPSGTYGDALDTEQAEAHEMAHLPRAVRVDMLAERRGRWSRPWRAGVDLPRGLLQGLQMLIHYLLMLVAMSFNIWWILAVVLGSGVGETIFGRFGASGGGH